MAKDYLGKDQRSTRPDDEKEDKPVKALDAADIALLKTYVCIDFLIVACCCAAYLRAWWVVWIGLIMADVVKYVCSNLTLADELADTRAAKYIYAFSHGECVLGKSYVDCSESERQNIK